MTSQTVNDEEKYYKKKIIENLNDEGGGGNYWNFEGWEKENIETLNYEKKMENYGSNYKFF